MPLSGGGTASKPSGTTAVSGATIESAKFNSVVDDIYSIFNTARPVAYGGTGATSASAARTALGLAIGTDVQAYNAALAALTTAFVPASSSASASLALLEDTDNGTNKVTLQATAALAADRVATFPDLSGTVLYADAAQTVSAVHTFSAAPVFSAIPSLTGGAIQFPATQVASADANALDDYEEGTFTPTFSASGATFSYASQYGKYTKIGNRVLASIRIELNTSGNSLNSNSLSIAGFPFTSTESQIVSSPIRWSNATSSYVNLIFGLSAGGTSGPVLGATAASTTLGSSVNSNAGLHATNGSVMSTSTHYTA